MFKNKLKLFLQQFLGINNYLFLFSILTIKRLKWNKHEEEFLYFNEMLPDNAIVMDIGANIGIMTVPIAMKVKNAQVYAFEPVPTNVKALKRIVNHYKLNNVKIFETALGEEAGELKMVMPVSDKVKMQGLSHVLEGDVNDAINQGDIFSVPVRKLDDIEELKAADKINAIKIDVENFEYYVLKGGEALLRKHKPIIYCELWDNEKRYMTLNYLKGLGYKVKVYQNEKLVDYTDQKVINFFLMP
jgi:FkbM family methyltransferase